MEEADQAKCSAKKVTFLFCCLRSFLASTITSGSVIAISIRLAPPPDPRKSRDQIHPSNDRRKTPPYQCLTGKTRSANRTAVNGGIKSTT
jgi:hypothetical protein